MSYISDLRRSYKRYRLYNRYSNPVNVFLVDVLWYTAPLVLGLLVLAFGHSLYLSLVQNQQQSQLYSTNDSSSGELAREASLEASPVPSVAESGTESGSGSAVGIVERADSLVTVASGDSSLPANGALGQPAQATLESTVQAARVAALQDGSQSGQEAGQPSALARAQEPAPAASSTNRLAVNPNVLIEVATDTGSDNSTAGVQSTAADDAIDELGAEPGAAGNDAAGALQAPPAILRDSWIFDQDDSKYTVQFGSSASRALLREFAAEFPAGTELVIYQSRRASADSEFGMIHGVFDSIREATAALDALPQEVLRYEPWIRSFSDLKTKVRVTE